MRRSAFATVTTLALCVGALVLYGSQEAQARPSTDPEPGQLRILDVTGKPAELCPLKGTTVNASISGFGAQVTVVQTFINPSKDTIEAVYTFPLPADAAVDRMRIKVGDRVIEGEIKRREEARRIYDAAKNAGQTAALLDQERPNIFTQSVANIVSGAEIQVEISYLQILKYDEGEFEFRYPMVVGPRFLGNAPDPEKIDPPRTAPGTRSGANIDLTVWLDAGATIQEMSSELHAIKTDRQGASRAKIQLARKDEIPNRDFVLKYRTATDQVQSALLTSKDDHGRFFSLVLMPPRTPRTEQIAPREMIFVMDQSGSQSGFPIEKSKELTLKLIKTLRPKDTFNVFGFNNTVRSVFPAPRPASPENIMAAESFVNGMDANGGTQLLEGLNAALEIPKDPRRLRLVVFNTDGFVGDEAEILDRVVRSRDTTRIFTFGIGNGINDFLIQKMSYEGRGDHEIVSLAADADKAVDRFLSRTRTPVLTDVHVQFEGVEVADRLPEAIPDVFSDKPIVIHGRLLNEGKGRVLLTGRVGGEMWSSSYEFDFSGDKNSGSVPKLWARAKIEDLQSKSYLNMVRRAEGDDFTDQITDVALEFGLMSQYTSFVAVEPRVVNIGGKQYTVRVPVERADGLAEEQGGNVARKMLAAPAAVAYQRSAGAGAGSGLFRGGAGGGGMADKNSRLEAEIAGLSAEQQKELRFKTVVEKSLRDKKGELAIMIWLTKTDQETLDLLKKAGLKLEEVDGTLKIALGVCDAAALKELASVVGVDRIEGLE